MKAQLTAENFASLVMTSSQLHLRGRIASSNFMIDTGVMPHRWALGVGRWALGVGRWDSTKKNLSKSMPNMVIDD